MKVKRVMEMSELERAIMRMVWNDVKELPEYYTWRGYKRNFTHDNKQYTYECKFKIEVGHLKLSDCHIEYKQVIIDIMH